MSESSSSAKDTKKKPKKPKKPEPRDLPERVEEHGDPFEQLNTSTKESSDPDTKRGLVQPRALPKHEEDLIREAARLLQSGESRDEVAKRLKIEPLQLRSWEQSYSSFFQKDLNEGEYHDTDAQLRDLDEDEKEKFQGNWEQVTEKSTERRIKVSPRRAKMMEHPVTRWMFRSEHGDVDYGAIIGIVVALIGLGVALRYVNQSRSNPTAAEDDAGLLIGLEDLTAVEHDPKAAAQAVIDFHHTKTWEEKLKYVSNPEAVRSRMEQWYTKNPDDVYFEHLTFVMDQPIEEQEREFIQIGLIVAEEEGNCADARNFVMLVERMENAEYKVEWETSSGYQPKSLEELKGQETNGARGAPAEPSLDNFFNFDFEEDTYFSFRGTYLGEDDPLFVYGHRDDPKIQAMESTLQLLPSKGYIVKVRYPENPRTDDQLEIVEIVADTWFRDYDTNK